MIGHQGCFGVYFPEFIHAFEDYVKSPKWHQANQNGDLWWSPYLTICPYHIFCFIDCKKYQINLPFAGPSRDFNGAGRKPRYDITQCAFYTHHGKMHGIKIETIYLPNSFATIFSPMSCRCLDIGGGSSL
ncbi:LOW QUALITY PROTEIN: hypothetical protein ACHAW6_004501 [Cyclotella cf. meneghiniana]